MNVGEASRLATFAYLVESWTSATGWSLVGWFIDFAPAMGVATSFSIARVRLVDLEDDAAELGWSGLKTSAR